MPPLPPDLDPGDDDVFERIEAHRRAERAVADRAYRRGFIFGAIGGVLASLLAGLWL